MPGAGGPPGVMAWGLPAVPLGLVVVPSGLVGPWGSVAPLAFVVVPLGAGRGPPNAGGRIASDVPGTDRGRAGGRPTLPSGGRCTVGRPVPDPDEPAGAEGRAVGRFGAPACPPSGAHGRRVDASSGEQDGLQEPGRPV